MIISLYGKKYDITNFIDKHPGGSNIFKNFENGDDLTPLYNTYHFQKSKTVLDHNIEKHLKLIDEGEYNIFTFDKDGFYNIVRDRVMKSMKYKNHKADITWLIKVSITIIMTLYLINMKTENNYYECIIGLIVGFLSISATFNILHDSSHYAISKNSSVNEFISKTIQALVLWNNYLWFRHHVYAHHSFTGEPRLDPDIKNYKPFIRKYIGKHLEHEPKHQEYYVIPLLGFVPGQYFGQIIQYANFVNSDSLWGVKITNTKVFSNIYERLLYFSMVFLNFYGLYYRTVFTLCFYITTNFIYFICIAPDHDTYESTILNHESKSRDWGEIQVRRSSNFGTKWPIVCFLFGGINYQIEHHLFPDVCHVNYPEISKIVKETCKEFDIPYVELSWYSAIVSCLKTYKYFGDR